MNSVMERVEVAETPIIIIDDEFKHLMPPLGNEEHIQLTASILEHGCRDAIVLWEGILIDGHNRYEICTKYEIPFKTVSLEFSSREQVLIWIIKNQMARRNLTPMQMVHFRGLHYRTEKKVATDKNWKNQFTEGLYQNDTDPQETYTRNRLADNYKVSQATISRDAKASEGIDALGEVSSTAKEKVLLHEVKLSRNKLSGLASAPKEEVEKLAREIEDGTYNPKPQADAAGDSAPDNPGSALGGANSGVNATELPAASALGLLTGIAYHALLDVLKNGSTEQVKKSLRSFMAALEELYVRL